MWVQYRLQPPRKHEVEVTFMQNQPQALRRQQTTVLSRGRLLHELEWRLPQLGYPFQLQNHVALI